VQPTLGMVVLVGFLFQLGLEILDKKIPHTVYLFPQPGAVVTTTKKQKDLY